MLLLISLQIKHAVAMLQALEDVLCQLCRICLELSFE